jgi:hypothetical protein
MYNQDAHICVMCDEEPAVYRGLCATCLYDSEFGGPEPTGRVKTASLRKDRDKDDFYGD